MALPTNVTLSQAEKAGAFALSAAALLPPQPDVKIVECPLEPPKGPRERKEEKEAKLEKEKRRQANELKNTTFQTITKLHKLKTMSKKQLRQIKRQQFNQKTGQIEFVSAWGGDDKKGRKRRRK